MTSQSDCFICRKHKNLKDFCGEVIAERGGLMLTHFPFLSDEQATPGHLLIEPKRHITDFADLSDEEASSFGGLIKLAAGLIRNKMGAEHVYVFRINDKVPHLHFHLVPRYPNTPREFWGTKILEWPDRRKATLEEIQEIAQSLKRSISR